MSVTPTQEEVERRMVHHAQVAGEMADHCTMTREKGLPEAGANEAMAHAAAAEAWALLWEMSR